MPRMRNALLCLFILSAAFFSGCARAKVTTELHADGSFKRTVELSGSAKQEGSAMASPALTDIFALPAGPGWKQIDNAKPSSAVSAVNVAGTKPSTEDTRTFQRLVPAGGALKGDLTIKESGTKLLLVNEATVTKIGPNRYEYKETLRWVGTPPKEQEADPQAIADAKAVLPPELATDANAKALIQRVNRLAIPMLFGPGDPLLTTGWMHPDLASRRITQKVGGLMVKSLEEQFGDKLTPEQRHEIVRKAIESSFRSTKPSQPDPGSDKQSSSPGSLTPLTFVLKAPGKLISSNGEWDDFNGEVYWAFYPEAASLQPLVLTAVYEVPAK